ncbi:MAG: PIN domain-containing protein [Actinomycetota bacterium]|nr:PIN domain-containing protein [Actinomycetota bacterium]
MKRLILDTTFLIDAERSKINLDDVIGDQDDVAIAAITVAELLVGVAVAKGRTKQTRQSLVDEVVASIPVLDYDLTVARTHADLLAAVRRHGRPRGAHDLIIAATALAANRILVSADSTAFVDLPGVAVISYR